MSTRTDPDPELDTCPHGCTAGQYCPLCDAEEDRWTIATVYGPVIVYGPRRELAFGIADAIGVGRLVSAA